jgi:glutamyl-tRNA synthetase
LPEAFINLLALLGWNDGTEKELFTMEELIQQFSMERVHSAGAKFDFEKAKWFNHEWIKKSDADYLLPIVRDQLTQQSILVSDDVLLKKVIDLTKERCTLLPDFVQQSSFFFVAPTQWDEAAVKPKWNDDKKAFFESFIAQLKDQGDWSAPAIENSFKELATAKAIKPGELQLPLRIMLVGGKFGPPVFEIAAVIGKEETVGRIERALEKWGK